MAKTGISRKTAKKTILDIYLEKIGKIPPLTRGQEVELAQKIEAGDQSAKDRFIKANLALVVSVAKRFIGRSLNLTFLGLIQEGNFGLVKAVENFDWRLGYRFRTYATKCIIGTIRNSLRWERRITRAAFSLDGDISKVGEDYEFSGRTTIVDHKAVCPSQEADKNFVKTILLEALSKLSPKERQVITMYFGLGDGIVYGDQEIAQYLGITRTRVHQIKRNALRALRNHRKLKGLV